MKNDPLLFEKTTCILNGSSEYERRILVLQASPMRFLAFIIFLFPQEEKENSIAAFFSPMCCITRRRDSHELVPCTLINEEERLSAGDKLVFLVLSRKTEPPERKSNSTLHEGVVGAIHRRHFIRFPFVRCFMHYLSAFFHSGVSLN